jgi:uncharacterized repeat protein (TIGR01451 family)
LLGSWGAVGDTLNLDPGVWTQNPTSFAFQWYRCHADGTQCAAISGATGIAWTVVTADLGHELYAATFATNASGTGVATTYLSGVVGAPTLVSEPVISGDANVNGTTLTVSHGNWTGTPTSFAYQWSRCDRTSFDCTPIPGATGSTYQVSLAVENGNYLQVKVTASDATGSANNIADPSFANGVARTDVISTMAPVLRPTAAIAPSWTGDASQTGNVLVGDRGVWLDHPTSLPYQWYDCDSTQNNCIQIVGAISLTYAVQAADAGHTIEFAIEGSNAFGAGGRYGGFGSLVNNTYASDSGPGWAPEPIVPPELRGDATGIGSMLSVSGVTWSAPHDNNITVTYQWMRCDGNYANCTPIPGATSFNYMVAGADLGSTLYVIVDGRNSYGTTSVNSTTITPPLGAPVNAGPPLITGNTGGLGKTLAVSTGTWSNDPTSYHYQWVVCDPGEINCSLISGGVTASHLIAANEFGKVLFVEVDATNSNGTTAGFSAATALIGAPDIAAAPVLLSTDTLSDGTPVAFLGNTLGVGQTSWNGDGSPISLSYQWYRCDPSSPTEADFTNCNAIGGATSASHTTVGSDLGHTIYLEIDATNAIGTGSAFAYPHGSVGAPQPLLDNGSIGGTAQVGQTVTFVNGTSWRGDTPIAWRYTWRRCDSAGNNCANIPGAAAGTYTLVQADQGHEIEGMIFGTNAWGGNGWGLAYTTAVVVAAATSGGGAGGTNTGSGSGSGGGSGHLDLAVAVSASAAQVDPGANVTYVITVTDLTNDPANDLVATVTLPPGAQVVSTYSDRGSGCAVVAGSATVPCDLNYLSKDSPVGHITLVVKLNTAGANTFTATAAARQVETNTTNNSASATVQVGAPPAPTPVSTTPSNPPGSSAKTSTLVGTAGGDVLNGTARNERLDGRAGNDVIRGGRGNDVITGGPGRDRLYGGPGNDTIYARDGERDIIDCGPGNDTVYVDKKDAVAHNCETIHRR